MSNEKFFYLLQTRPMKVCYFGIYNSEFSRNKVYQKGLREKNIEIIECCDNSLGILKFWRLWSKHRKIKENYDIMIVGYPGQIVAPFAKLISNKKVILDALCSLYEGEIISRQSASKWSFMRLKFWLIDFFAYQFADLILVETEAQKDFFNKNFFVRNDKCVRVFTGADDSLFFANKSVKKRDRFTVVFRGQFLPEAGVEIIVKSAKILEKENIDFLLMGGGFLKKKIGNLISTMSLKNLYVLDKFLSFDEIRDTMLSCHVSLGQFGLHDRLNRTIPHKAFETLAMGMPYITGRADGILELLVDKKNCLMSNLADPNDLALKILELKNNPILLDNIAKAGLDLYKNSLKPSVLADEILKNINKIK